MKSLLLLSCLIFSGLTFAQSDSTLVTEDTTDIYVINSTNRIMQVGDNFSIEFRDLKSLKELHYIRLDNQAEVQKFFNTCYKVLDKNVEIVGQKYTIKRNIVSKSVVRISHHDGAYFMLSYDTIEKMEKAFNRILTSEETE
ncbi:MAG: hypothetical protein Crog4KO_19600 [Crocinitomicaceae bacterium]